MYEQRIERLTRNGWKHAITFPLREITPTLLAQLRANRSTGDSGFFGGLAAATGAVLAGGNAEQVMGMAMKGAEVSTDNEMTRNVLAGQGDRMIADGTQRMVEERSGQSAGLREAEGNMVASASVQSSSTGSGTSAQPTSGSGSETGGLVPKTFTFYMFIGMNPVDTDTRNPNCISNVLTVPFQGSNWGDAGRKNEIFQRYKAGFYEQCVRSGRQMVGDVSYAEDQGYSPDDFGIPKAGDMKVIVR